MAWCCLAVWLSSTPATRADAPTLAAGQRIYIGDSVLDVGMFAAPTVCDWNNDGRSDLVVGQYDYGYINLITNNSSGAIPAFATSNLILSMGSPISISRY